MGPSDTPKLTKAQARAQLSALGIAEVDWAARLQAAVRADDVDMVRRLVHAGPPSPKKPPAPPVRKGKPVARAPEPYTFQAALFDAVAEGRRAEVVAALLAGGVDVKATTMRQCGKNRKAALHFAAGRGDRDVAALLLDAGADVEQRDAMGSKPLYFACSSGCADVVKLLLDAGATPAFVKATP